MIYVFLFTILFIKESKGEWKPVWNDEFENQTLDTEKWEIENELNSCHGNYLGQLNCNTNSERNMRLIDGTLAITAMHEKHLNKNYTSGKIETKQSFIYGRFEIRAAMPDGKMLRPAIFMFPVISSDWARNGQIDIMSSIQCSRLSSGLHYNTPAVYETNTMGGFTTDLSLNDFHTYAIEWNQFELKWFFDDINYMSISINRSLGSIYTRNGEPFNMPFRLVIHLGVGGLLFSSRQKLTVKDVMDWKCSLLIIDYVRIYEWVNSTEKFDFKSDRSSADDICSHVRSLITPKKELNSQLSPNVTPLVITISVISFVLLILLISIFVFFVRQKKLKRMKVDYDDCFNTEEYDIRNTSYENYNHYEEINDNYVECNATQTSCKKIDQKQNINLEPIYLEITNKT